MAWRCERWNALPDSGGIYDQEYQMLSSMGVLSNIYNTVVRVRNMKGAQIHNLSDGERRILRNLIDEELM